MFENKKLHLLFIILIIIASVGYFSGLTIDVTRDAGKYATISKEIFQNGNVINLTIHGDAYDQKPPMLFWMGAFGFLFGGVSNFWFKLPILFLIFAGFYWTFKLGKSLYNKRVGFLAAVMVGFSFIYSLYSMDIHTDTVLQAFVTLAFWQLYEFIKTKKNIHCFIGFVAIGLAMLSKGPIGAVLPGFAVVGHLILKKDFKRLLDYRWFVGIGIAFIVASPALIGLMNQFGWEGIRFFFWDNNVGRITGSYIQANNDPFFYVHNLAYLFLPWSLLFFIAAFSEFRFLIKNRFQSGEFYTLAGIWIYFIVLNSASSQLPNYIFSIIPLVAVLTAKWMDIAINQKQKLFKIMQTTQIIVVAFLWTVLFLLVFYLFPIPSWYYFIPFVPGIGVTIFFYAKKEYPYSGIVLPSLIIFTCITLLFNTYIFPSVFSLQAPPKAARYFTENSGSKDKLFNYRYEQYELFFYSEPQALQINSSEDLKETVGKKGNWIFTNADGLKDLQALEYNPDTLIEYKHLYLNKGGQFINPKTRDNVLQPMYLLKY